MESIYSGQIIEGQSLSWIPCGPRFEGKTTSWPVISSTTSTTISAGIAPEEFPLLNADQNFSMALGLRSRLLDPFSYPEVVGQSLFPDGSSPRILLMSDPIDSLDILNRKVQQSDQRTSPVNRKIQFWFKNCRKKPNTARNGH